MSHIRMTALAVVLLSPISGTGSCVEAGPIFNAVADFSIGGNPNGVWTYGEQGPSGLISLNHPSQAPGYLAWDNFVAVHFVSIGKNTTDTPRISGTVVQPPNLLALEGINTVVRWTAPAAGLYDVDGLFERIDTNSEPISVSILLDGLPLFEASRFEAIGSANAFDLRGISFSAGDTLDFVEQSGFAVMAMGLAATITPSAVPELSSVTLCCIAGLAGLVGRRVYDRLDSVREEDRFAQTG